MHNEHQIPIWFFIGGLLLIYGVLITGAGLYALVVPPPEESRVALYYLHSKYLVGRVHGARGVVLLHPLLLLR
jgi:hypothetical protein